MQERRNAIATALDLSLSCTNLSIWYQSKSIVSFGVVNQALIYMYDISKGVEKVPSNMGTSVNMLYYNEYTMTPKLGPRFINGFSVAIQIRLKFRFTLASILIQWSQQVFALGTTAVLSWHVQKLVAIWWREKELEQGEFSIEFVLRAKNR